MGSKSKSVEVGARYYFDIHMGIGLALVDEFIEIEVGDRRIWSGSVTDNTSIYIRKAALFGGDEGEGGIKGTLKFMFGDPDQAIDQGLSTVHGALVPGFRGACTLFFSGLVSAMSKYPKPWRHRFRSGLRNYPGGVWYPSKATIDIDGVKALNPAHILHRCCVDPLFGRGLPRAKLGSSFDDCADTLFNEGFGMCIGWNGTGPVTDFMDVILSTIGGSIYQHPQTGLVEMSLTRDDQDINDMLSFSPSTGLLEITNDDNAGTSSSINEVIVRYTNPETGKPASAGVQNIASIHNGNGAIRSVTLDFPGIPSGELALRVAQRELRMRSGLLKVFTVVLDRRGLQVLPGSAFVISHPRKGIDQLVVRAGDIDYGTIRDGRITVDVVQDVFGLPATSFTAVATTSWTPPSTVALPITEQRVVEASYLDLVSSLDTAQLNALAPESCALMAIAKRPQSLSTGFTLATRISPADYQLQPNNGVYAPTALLDTAIAITESAVVVTVKSATDLDELAEGSVALVNDELFRVDAINGFDITLARACGDTLPQTHSVDDRIWFYEFRYVGKDDTNEYLPAQTIDTKLVNNTSTGAVDINTVIAESITMAQRKQRPYPPARLRFNDTAYPASVPDDDDIVITWANRNRLTQAEQMIDASVGNITPEAGTTVTIRIYDGATLLRTESGLAGTAWTYTLANIVSDGDAETLRFEVESERDSLVSTYHYDVTIDRVTP